MPCLVTAPHVRSFAKLHGCFYINLALSLCEEMMSSSITVHMLHTQMAIFILFICLGHLGADILHVYESDRHWRIIL